MRTSTLISLFSLGLWFVFQILANSAAPTGLSGFDGYSQNKFRSQIDAANTLQAIGGLFFLSGLVSGGIAIYRNIMDRGAPRTYNAPHIEHSPGAAIADRGGTAAASGASIADRSGNASSRGGDTIDNSIRALRQFLNNSTIDESDKRFADLLLAKLEEQKPDSGGSSKSGYVSDLARIIEGVGNLTDPVRSALESLRKILG